MTDNRTNPADINIEAILEVALGDDSHLTFWQQKQIEKQIKKTLQADEDKKKKKRRLDYHRLKRDLRGRNQNFKYCSVAYLSKMNPIGSDVAQHIRDILISNHNIANIHGEPRIDPFTLRVITIRNERICQRQFYPHSLLSNKKSKYPRGYEKNPEIAARIIPPGYIMNPQQEGYKKAKLILLEKLKDDLDCHRRSKAWKYNIKRYNR